MEASFNWVAPYEIRQLGKNKRRALQWRFYASMEAQREMPSVFQSLIGRR